MRRYETIVIIDPDSSEETRKPIFDRITGLIQQQDGFLANFDEWGNRKLAYEIKKKNRGYYTLIDFCGTGPLVNEMERFFRIDDLVLKFMTVLLDKSPDIDQIKDELAKAKAEKENKTASTEPDAAPSSSETPETDADTDSKTVTEAPEAAVEETESTPTESSKEE